MLLDQLGPAPAQYVAQDESDDDRIIQIASDGNEVGHEVERHREVGDERGEDDLPAPRDAAVRQEPPEQDDKVRDEAHCAGRFLAAGNDEPDEERA